MRNHFERNCAMKFHQLSMPEARANLKTVPIDDAEEVETLFADYGSNAGAQDRGSFGQ
jgi:hypothetical protein